jgi:hypothetical protein
MSARRGLERARLFTLVVHAVAMVSMAALLLPGMPGGGVTDDVTRVAYIAAHPWRWRFGWLPWQLTALSDLLLSIALLATPWIPRGPARIVAVLTAAAVVPDQIAQWLWVTRGIDLARAGDVADYMRFETAVFPLTAGWAACFYTAGAIGWSVCFARAGVWSRALARIAWPTWSLFALVSIAPLLPEGLRPPAFVVSTGNAIGFVLLEVWLALVTERVLRRLRPDDRHGRLAPWRHPGNGAIARLLDVIANSRLVRALCAWLPSIGFRSDIRDVVYVNYMVDAERLARWVPDGLELQRLGAGKRYALFTFLTYRHGHFGPTLAGPLRRVFGSPVQSNWRIYVRNPRTGHEGIYFVTTAITTTLHAVGARLMTDGLPMHRLARGEVRRDDDGALHVALDPGAGSAPDATATLRPARPVLPPAFAACFHDYRAMLAYTVPQDRALSSQPWAARITRQEIALGIPLESCEPLAGDVSSRAVRAIVGDDDALAVLSFRVPSVPFRFEGEAKDAM